MSEIFVFCVPDNVFKHLTLADNFFTIEQQAICARVPLLHLCAYHTSEHIRITISHMHNLRFKKQHQNQIKNML